MQQRPDLRPSNALPLDTASVVAVIFDMDGVIVDSEPLHERAFLDVFAELGYAATHGVNFADYYGRSDEALWQDFVARHHPPQAFAELLDRIGIFMPFDSVLIRKV